MAEQEGTKDILVRIVSAPGDPRVPGIVSALQLAQGSIFGYESRTGTTKRRVPLAQIAWMEAADDDTFLHLAEGETLVAARRLQALETVLEGTQFVRASRQAIVNLDRVSAIRPEFGSRLVLTLEGGDELLVTRSHVREIKERIGMIPKDGREP